LGGAAHNMGARGDKYAGRQVLLIGREERWGGRTSERGAYRRETLSL